MHRVFGYDAGIRKRTGEISPVKWDSQALVNGHILMTGMSGAGKTYQLRKLISDLQATAPRGLPLRFHIFDVHDDIHIDGASSVMFSEQSHYGMNPLKVNPDPHFGGVRKRVQGFINTINRVGLRLGPKQEAVLRNVLYDVYARHGFKQDDPSTWHVDDNAPRLMSDGADNRLYLDVPYAEKDEASALGARFDRDITPKSWWIPADEYHGGITRWPPKMLARTQPTLGDALNYARHILQQSFLGTGMRATVYLEAANRAAANYQKKLLESLRRGESGFVDEKLKSTLDKAREKAIAAFTDYANAIATGRELTDLLKYDSTDVLKSVVDRLENYNASGICSAKAPPFDPLNPVWRYRIKSLSMQERRLFVLFRLEELFQAAVQRGEQQEIVDFIILDEAHIYADDDPDNILNTIAKEARKFGVALVCASQSPTHFTEDFISSVATKIILGVDEGYWRQAASKMRLDERALSWITLQRTMLVQFKTKGEAKSQWQWTVIQ